ncbi:MAG: UDP-N-acetylglucosamine--N-acetylmuramyl-(pentapeptide) pyrophosphoryl-undecaprenol N-acetylglucosamine transferase [candidate division WOR-3 bacterium]
MSLQLKTANYKLILCAGGTGGHIFPGLALATELRTIGAQIIWVGRNSGLEKGIASKNKFKFHPINAFPLPSAISRLPSALAGLLQSIALINRLQPKGVIATGAYVSAPLLLAAMIKKVPFYLLEQNRIPGRVVRLFAPYARQTFLTFPLQSHFPVPFTVAGTPLRKSIIQKAKEFSYPPTHGRIDRTVLILGGSQGARPLNIAAIKMAALLKDLRFILLTGRRDYHALKNLNPPSNCELVQWTDHPEEFYIQASLAITRAGGLVLSELLLFGIPLVVIPFPHARDNHQDANARYLESNGAALRLSQADLSRLPDIIQNLVFDTQKLLEMSKRARTLAHPDGAHTIAQAIIADLSRNNQKSKAVCSVG